MREEAGRKLVGISLSMHEGELNWGEGASWLGEGRVPSQSGAMPTLAENSPENIKDSGGKAGRPP